MDNIFDEFLTKKISPKELLTKLKKVTNYICYNEGQKDSLNTLIYDIKYIIDTKDSKEQYEDILILFNQYLKKEKLKKETTTYNLKKLDEINGGK